SIHFAFGEFGPLSGWASIESQRVIDIGGCCGSVHDRRNNFTIANVAQVVGVSGACCGWSLAADGECHERTDKNRPGRKSDEVHCVSFPVGEAGTDTMRRILSHGKASEGSMNGPAA